MAALSAVAVLLGAAAAGAGEASDVGVGDAGSAAAASPPAGTQAFYILFADQVTSPDWPERICQNAGVGPQGAECVPASKYKNGVFIASPAGLTKELIAKVRADVPGSRVVAYWDFGDIPIVGRSEAECPFCHDGHIMGDRPGRNCSTTYHCRSSAFSDALQKAFPPQLAVHDITDGTPGVMVESYPGLPKYVWNNASAPLLAKFLSGWLKDHGFDGLYMGARAQPPFAVVRHHPLTRVRGVQTATSSRATSTLRSARPRRKGAPPSSSPGASTTATATAWRTAARTWRGCTSPGLRPSWRWCGRRSARTP